MNMEKEERKNEYDNLLSKIEEGIEDHALKCLFKCFYQPLDFDKTEHCNTLNTGLNLFFFGKGIHKHEKWQNGFKSSIKEKYQSSSGKFKLKDPSQNMSRPMLKESLLFSHYESMHNFKQKKPLFEAFYFTICR